MGNPAQSEGEWTLSMLRQICDMNFFPKYIILQGAFLKRQTNLDKEKREIASERRWKCGRLIFAF